jgi:Pentapeptide repeats (8 copies)
MAGLARAIYNPRWGEQAGDPPHPAKLCDFADRLAVEAHLFDEFIPAAYRPPTKDRWTAEQAEKWLVFLARQVDHEIGGVDIAWWQLEKAVPRIAFRLLAGVVIGLVVGLAWGLVVGLAWGFVWALVVGLVWGLVAGLVAGSSAETESPNAKAPSRDMRISVKRLVFAPVLTLAAGLYIEVQGGIARTAGAFAGWLIAWLLFGLVLGLVTGHEVVPGDLAAAMNPRAVLARDRRVALLLMLVFGLVGGLVTGLVVMLVFSLRLGLVFFGLGLVFFGLGLGLIVSWTRTAWLSYMLARGWLAFRHSLPWSVMSFLADAHRRGVLRQAGAVYQFRHINLQHRLTDYTRAIEQLGSKKLDERIGGIYALERAARDAARNHLTVMEVLSAFIRDHSREQWPLPEHGTDPTPPRTTRPDVQAALTVVGRRNAKHDIPGRRIDLTGADLTGADLTGADLAGADLTGADLTGARLHDTDLVRVFFNAILHHADRSSVNLTGARLADARWPRGEPVPEGWKLDTSSGLLGPGLPKLS